MTVHLVPASWDHVELIEPRVRQADRDEAWACARLTARSALVMSLQTSTGAWAGFVDDEIVCLFGVSAMSLAGGVGTIAGAVLGALVMQSLNSGMVLLGMDAPLQSIVIGMVLVLAVWLDTIYRARAR